MTLGSASHEIYESKTTESRPTPSSFLLEVNVIVKDTGSSRIEIFRLAALSGHQITDAVEDGQPVYSGWDC